MAEFPALPLFTDAFLADCGHLNDAERGRYFLMLMIIWRTPDTRIPNDLQWLSRKFQRPVDAIEAEIMPLVREFCQCDKNWITQKRLSKEMNYCRQQSQKQRDRAKSGWNKRKSISRGIAASGNAPTPTPTPTPTNNPSLRSGGAHKRGTRIPDGWEPDEEGKKFASSLLNGSCMSELDKFRDYWRAKPGQGGIKLDWSATWRNWCRKASEQGEYHAPETPAEKRKRIIREALKDGN